jgi:hypothetical protein
MTRKKSITKAQSSFDKPDPFQLGEMGISGAPIFAGIPANEIKRELNFPTNLTTFKQMMLHPAVNASISLYKSMLSKATFRVLPCKNPTAKEKFQAKKIEEMLADMDTPLEDVVSSSLSALEFGFAPLEKVFRLREKASGSKYNDGLIGIKKLALRHQESIDTFIFDDDGNEVLGLKQSLTNVNDPMGRYTKRAKGDIVLPREKFMLFNVGNDKSNPYGTSPLRNVYLPWRYLQSVEELEASGIAKDLQGLPFIRIPAQYMSADASTEQKAAFEGFKNMGRNLQQNAQAAVVFPSDVDPDTRTPLFNLELLSTEGKKSFDTTKIKEYYRTMIFIGLSADILLMGNTQTGSFALGAIKNSLTGATVEGYLKGIVQTFNLDLIKHLYELNDWDTSRMCSLDYEGYEDVDLDSFSKSIQRIGSVGFLPRTIDVVNDIMRKHGLDELPAGTDLDEVLPEKTSKASEGMKTPADGTANEVTGKDSASLNTENS